MQTLLAYLSDHTTLAYAAVFVAAFGEAVAFVGTFVPGSSIVIAGGALIGAGVLDMRACFALGIVGAVLGDGLSYELGSRFRGRIYGSSLAVRFSASMERAERYLQKRGGWSIVIGRFAPPTHAIVPVLAGVSGMSRSRFYAWNVASAIAWVTAHLVPGMVAGASIEDAGVVSWRLWVLILAILGAAWLLHFLAPHLLRAARVALRAGARQGIPSLLSRCRRALGCRLQTTQSAAATLRADNC